MKKTIAVLLAAVLMLMCFAGCGAKKEDAAESDWDYVENKGTLIIGYTVFAPIAYEENGEFIGFDVDLAKAVCEELGIEAEFQLIDWDAKETELKAKSIDCIWNGLTITEDRLNTMEISMPYLKNQQVVVVKAEDLAEYTDANAVAGKSVAAEAGSAGAEAMDNYPEVEYELVKTDNQLLALVEVLSGTSNAAIIDSVMAGYYINTEGSSFTDLAIVETIEFAPEEYGIAFRKDSDVAAKVNEALLALKENGKLDEIADKYGLTDYVIVK